METISFANKMGYTTTVSYTHLDVYKRQIMTQEEYETALQDADVMVSNCIHAPTSYLEYFGNSHNVKDMLLSLIHI